MPDYSGLPLNTPTVVEDTPEYQKWANRSSAGYTEWLTWKAGKAPLPEPMPAAQSLTDLYGGTAGVLSFTFPRMLVASNAVAPLVSGQLVLVGIVLPSGMPVSNIIWWSGSIAAATPTNQWAALFDANRNRLAISADALTAAWPVNKDKKFTLTTPYLIPTSGFYYLGLMVKATTVPNLSGMGGLGTGPRAAPPIMVGMSTAGLTTPATCPATAGALSAGASIPYVEVS